MPVLSGPPNRRWLCQLLLLIALFALAVGVVWWYFDSRIEALQGYVPF
jgi:cell division protein FtsL